MDVYQRKNIKSDKKICGKRFGKVVAMYKLDKRSNGNYLWHVKCDCGNEFDTNERNLIRGFTTHCGCLRKKNENPYYTDLTGMHFGELSVLYKTKKRVVKVH